MGMKSYRNTKREIDKNILNIVGTFYQRDHVNRVYIKHTYGRDRKFYYCVNNDAFYYDEKIPYNFVKEVIDLCYKQNRITCYKSATKEAMKRHDSPFTRRE